jgi:hypothetical protein
VKKSKWSGWLLDWLLIYAVSAFLILPLFKVKYFDLWGSIESTFIADARFLHDHWPHPNWQPNWYLGTRTDYVYPPALRYGTAGLLKLIPIIIPVRAYHLYIAIFYCFGIAAVYLLIRAGSGSRWAGWIGALSVALTSPSYLFVPSIRTDSPFQTPYRLNVLIRYGEGPHMTSLAWLAFTLAFAYRALVQFRPVALATAALGSAMIASNNFYGATALAVLYPLLVMSVWITHRDLTMFLRAAAIPALAYGLCAFWLVPSYLQITLNNMQFVSSQGNMWSVWVAIGSLMAFLLFADHFARGKRAHAYFVFICGALVIFCVMVLGNHYLDFRIIGEPSRLYPELDMIIILFSVELLRRLWCRRSRFQTAQRAVVVLIVALAWSTSWNYLMHRRSIFRTDYNLANRVEWQMQDWIARNMPQARAMAAGGVRFWYNVWNDLPQLGGGSEQGLTNQVTMPSQWEILLGSDAHLSTLWMQILGVDVALVNEKTSKEFYHDYQFPEKFAGKLPVLHDDKAGNIIYSVPRRYPSLARVIERTKLDAMPAIPGNGDLPTLTAWHDLVENGPEAPTVTQWDGTDRLHVKAPVGANQSVLVQVSYDTNWRAYSGGTQLPTRNTKLGLIVIDAPPGNHDIRLEFPTPFANWVGRGVTVLSSGALAALVVLGVRRRHLRT